MNKTLTTVRDVDATRGVRFSFDWARPLTGRCAEVSPDVTGLLRTPVDLTMTDLQPVLDT